MTNKPTLAIFDFCGTLINMQTADPFVRGLSKSCYSIRRGALELARKALRKAGMLRGGGNKTFILRQVAGIEVKSAMEFSAKFLNTTLLPNENATVVKKIDWHKKRGDEVVIVSAGYECYIGLWAKHHGIDKIAATRLEQDNGILTGRILNKDCLGTEKVRRLSELLQLSSFDLPNSYVYTDSISDAPLLELVGNKVVIDSGQDVKWSKEMGCEVLPV